MSSAPQFQLPPRDGFVVTHFLVVADQDRSRGHTASGALEVRDSSPIRSTTVTKFGPTSAIPTAI